MSLAPTVLPRMTLCAVNEESLNDHCVGHYLSDLLDLREGFRVRDL